MAMAQTAILDNTGAYRATFDLMPRRGRDAGDYRQVYSLTWQDCHDELACPDIDSAWRTQVELRLENIQRGSC